MMRRKILAAHACKNILYCTSHSILPKLSFKQSAKMICKFDGFETAHRKRQKAIYEQQKTYRPPMHLIT